ncbi:MAG: adenylyl-sulfate kinase [Acidilobus sp.]
MALCLKRGVVAWITGLPGSGKTTIAMRAKGILEGRGYRVEVLDGDWFRSHIDPEAGFTKEERAGHLRRAAWVARLLARNGVIVICSFVSPYRDVREEVRKIVAEEASFLEVYARCPLEECVRRDPKGLYRKALSGEIKHFTGVSDPYEEPLSPDLVLDSVIGTPEENARRLAEAIEAAVQR